MKVAIDWLSDHVDLSGYSEEELDDLLTFAGIEVEGIKAIPENVVVATIQSSEKHPDADKLSVCMVDDGTKTPRQIVCGAKNYQVGDNVPLALPGASLGTGFTIKKGKLRGIESNGMLCSAKELGGEEDSGLWILPPDCNPGTPLLKIFSPVFDLEITPNRPDCLSHLGIARELAVLAGRDLKSNPDHSNASIPEQSATGEDIRISATEECRFYTARRIHGIKVTESPAWLKTKLESIGLRPINNIVDITNYVLMEMGQPLHAFDADKITGGIHVRKAEDKETMIALDGLDYELTPEDLVIADDTGPVAIAGIMGGEATGVTGETTEILLESAYFSPAGIRRSGRRLGISSDSSYRFERGADPAQATGASELATNLITELAGGQAENHIVTCGALPSLNQEVELNAENCRKLLGCSVTNAEMFTILEQLGLRRLEEKGSISQWQIPSYRRDLTRPADLYEEVARVYGLDNIPSRQRSWFSEISSADRTHDFMSDIANRLSSIGFHETRTIKLTSTARNADNVCTADHEPIALKNPLNDELTHMRSGLVGALMEIAERNIHQGIENLRLFEMGTIFSNNHKGEETQHLGLLVSGPGQGSWKNPQPESADLFTLKGIIEAVTGANTTFLRSEDSTRGASFITDITLGKLCIGKIAEISPARTRELDARHPVYAAEIDLDILQKKTSAKKQYEDLPKFPSVSRDIAMEVDLSLTSGEIDFVLSRIKSPILESFRLFDLFHDESGKRLDAGKKSIAYSLTYRDRTRTLESSEVDSAHAEILSELKAKLPVDFR
ncbi:MAG: phenylalanine--tRNA ligase subunit beta [Verrucomicrobiaceae bacterium]|nr:phenylalanine--tRNA ligase subunit beta [Verrucomicrobiaceae bacterium]